MKKIITSACKRLNLISKFYSKNWGVLGGLHAMGGIFGEGVMGAP